MRLYHKVGSMRGNLEATASSMSVIDWGELSTSRVSCIIGSRISVCLYSWPPTGIVDLRDTRPHLVTTYSSCHQPKQANHPIVCLAPNHPVLTPSSLDPYIYLPLETLSVSPKQATMATNGDSAPDTVAMLKEILLSVRSLKQENAQLSASVDAINGRVNTLAGIKQIKDGVAHDSTLPSPKIAAQSKNIDSSLEGKDANIDESQQPSPLNERRPSTTSTSKIILTSYPGQAGVDPIPLKWGM